MAAESSFRIRVSIHASAREATMELGMLVLWENGFNPRLRTGGDGIRLKSLRASQVSIHASAREATGKGILRKPERVWVSIHASAREATYKGANGKTYKNDVSIHASAREATNEWQEG